MTGIAIPPHAWRQELQDLIAEFVLRADTGRHAELVELFARDGKFIFPALPLDSGKDVVYAGHEQLRQRWASGPSHATCHIVSLPLLRLRDVDSATGIMSMISYRGPLGSVPAADEPFIVGRFEDRYVREAGRWLIAERRLVVQFAGKSLTSPH
jgi:hypothetical protein